MKMDMKKILALIIFFTSTSHLAFASGWKSAGNNTYMNSKSILSYYNERHEIVENQYSFWTRHFNDNCEYFKAKEKSLGFFGKMKAAKIIKEARDPRKTSHLYFIKKGDKAHRKCWFDEYKNWTDEELLNATVVDKQGYYVRRGMIKANGFERRQGPGTDFFD